MFYEISSNTPSHRDLQNTSHSAAPGSAETSAGGGNTADRPDDTDFNESNGRSKRADELRQRRDQLLRRIEDLQLQLLNPNVCDEHGRRLRPTEWLQWRFTTQQMLQATMREYRQVKASLRALATQPHQLEVDIVNLAIAYAVHQQPTLDRLILKAKALHTLRQGRRDEAVTTYRLNAHV